MPMAAVIIPGLIICWLALVLVSNQESARMLDVRREYTGLLNRTNGQVDSITQQLVEKVFTKPLPGSGKAETILAFARNISLQHPVVKFPFIIDVDKGFLFPISQAAQLTPGPSPVSDAAGVIRKEKAAVKEKYVEAYNLEYKQKQLSTAIQGYLSCVQQAASPSLVPYLYNAVARCYSKLHQPRQAQAYYNTVLNRYPGLRGQDPLLYFTILRQQAVSSKQLSARGEAARVYLKLYEEILAQRGKAGAGPFAFYKNEALDFLNNRDNAKESADRFQRAKALDQLDNASELDISLGWQYFDRVATESKIENRNRSAVFMELKELYEADDEKTRFYNRVKLILQEPGKGERQGDSQTIQTSSFKDPVSGRTQLICYMRQADNKNICFGFLLSMQHVAGTILPEAAGRHLDRQEVSVAITDRMKEQTAGEALLVSMPMGSWFPGRHLAFYAQTPDFFQQVVRRDIRLYYVLLAALVFALTAGIFLFYKYIAREAELVRLKAGFVDSASHTLKTPLTRMSLLAENVTQGWVKDEKQKEEFFQAIVDETARMSEMIENMLNFSRIESGKQHYELQPVDLAQAVLEVVDSYATYARNLGFQLETELDNDLPVLNLDRGAVRLIVGNLLHNAVKYSAEEKNISVRLFRDNIEICLEISDRGIGIAENDQSLLFRKFSRIPAPRVKAAEGSGLGLYLVKHAVEAHKGRISVTSQLGKGTTFHISFPTE